MSSLPRRIARKRARANGAWVDRERAYRDEKDGYATLHPTKGWMRVSAHRLLAQNRLRYMIEAKHFTFGDIRP